MGRSRFLDKPIGRQRLLDESILVFDELCSDIERKRLLEGDELNEPISSVEQVAFYAAEREGLIRRRWWGRWQVCNTDHLRQQENS